MRHTLFKQALCHLSPHPNYIHIHPYLTGSYVNTQNQPTTLRITLARKLFPKPESQTPQSNNLQNQKAYPNLYLSMTEGETGKNTFSLAPASLSPYQRITMPYTYPMIRPITQGPQHHWFGYYDKWQIDPTCRYALSMEVDFEHRSPTADDSIKIGIIDMDKGDIWTEIATTQAWCWQQG